MAGVPFLQITHAVSSFRKLVTILHGGMQITITIMLAGYILQWKEIDRVTKVEKISSCCHVLY